MNSSISAYQQYTGTKYLLNDIDTVDHDGGVVSVRAKGHVKNCAILRVVDFLAIEHGKNLKGTGKTKQNKTKTKGKIELQKENPRVKSRPTKRKPGSKGNK